MNPVEPVWIAGQTTTHDAIAQACTWDQLTARDGIAYLARVGSHVLNDPEQLSWRPFNLAEWPERFRCGLLGASNVRYYVGVVAEGAD